ncbi:MAG: 4-phosphopantetheinyl transferase family protein [Flavobacterium sp.]|nr:4-phosphopantetheinyl transferase family protein [Flavobacterium sp.]
MIGNDVVDLTVAKSQSNWKRTGYLDKIFTSSEQDFIFSSNNQEAMIWSLWSRKEAVYKILIQNGVRSGYYPLQIECLDIDYENGYVIFENYKFKTKTTVINDLIHSVAIESYENFEKIIYLKNGNSLKKINGIPFYELNSKLYAASKSHHGKYEQVVYLQS